MPPPSKTLQQFVDDMESTWASELDITPNLSSGSFTLAMFYAMAAQLDFQTVAMLATVAFARATTATGSDLDSWMAQFGVTRLGATLASGPVTLSTLVANTAAAVIPVGSVVQTAGSNPIQYQLIADTNQSAFSQSANAYILPSGQLSITATAQALVAGGTSNVQAGQLVQFASAVNGISNVSNGAAIINGVSGETDDALRTRFVLKFFGQNWGTKAGIMAAALGVQAGLDVVVFENVNAEDSSQPGTVMVIIDDGSGSPPSGLINSVITAVQAVRPIGIQLIVQGPNKSTVTIALNIKVASTGVTSTVQANVQNALLNYTNGLTIDQELYLQKLNQIAIDADPNVITTEASATLINGMQLDVTAPTFGVIRTIKSNVTVGTF